MLYLFQATVERVVWPVLFWLLFIFSDIAREKYLADKVCQQNTDTVREKRTNKPGSLRVVSGSFLIP